MRSKVKFKRSFVYTKTLGHLQENPDLFNFTLQGPRFIGAGWAITQPIISRTFFCLSFCIHTSSCNLCVKSNVPIKHNANFLLSHAFVSLVFRAYIWLKSRPLYSQSVSIIQHACKRSRFFNLFFDCFISTIISLDYQIYATEISFSFRGWTIGVVNGMFLLLTKVLISRVL